MAPYHGLSPCVPCPPVMPGWKPCIVEETMLGVLFFPSPSLFVVVVVVIGFCCCCCCCCCHLAGTPPPVRPATAVGFPKSPLPPPSRPLRCAELRGEFSSSSRPSGLMALLSLSSRPRSSWEEGRSVDRLAPTYSSFLLRTRARARGREGETEGRGTNSHQTYTGGRRRPAGR